MVRRVAALAFSFATHRLVVAFAAACMAAGAARAQVPADIGQVWKTYDIAPFVQQAGPGSERFVVDWVLQETGYAAWHGASPASLSATPDKLACFHVPEMQSRVAGIVERFVAVADLPHRFQVHVFGFTSPAWRSEVRPVMQPIPAATPGVQAWIVRREDAAIGLTRLRSRNDCQELPTGPVHAANGLPAVLSGGRSLPYVQDVAVRPDWAGWQTSQGACDEGLSLDLQPLLSRDGSFVEAVFRCRIDQIERLAPVELTAPGVGGRVQVAVPQMAAVRIGERFRWPANQTLVIALGLVPWPVPAQNTTAAAVLTETRRRDVVVVVEPRLRGGLH
jgi:hypothetical protein